MSLPFLIPEPFKEKRHGSCRWFLARSDDDERLMTVRTYRTCCFAEYNHSHCKVFEQDPSFSGPSGIFDWRLVSSLGTRSLFVGLNYPINQEITDGKDHDGSTVSLIRQNMSFRPFRPRKGTTRSQGRRDSGCPCREEYEGSLVRLCCRRRRITGGVCEWSGGMA